MKHTDADRSEALLAYSRAPLLNPNDVESHDYWYSSTTLGLAAQLVESAG